ncbi:MAG: dTDP-4-dehydrorhamnose 3,5-epimerase [Nitrosomonadaceae bacterium]|nr:dTDP-4-dehydrorhamnose 3,5-epimerase [Nitrosomonadaceae bacterium]
MKFIATPLSGSYLIEPEVVEDERGFFARTFCQEEFLSHGLNFDVMQCSVSFNRKHGTLRGVHYQAAPHQEAKLVRCTMGAIYDVIVDIRVGSPTFGHWWGTDLTMHNRHLLYVPEGVAHGFQTLDDDTEVYYQMSSPYVSDSARGIRWNDPKFAICWPLAVSVISMRDSSYPDFSL